MQGDMHPSAVQGEHSDAKAVLHITISAVEE